MKRARTWRNDGVRRTYAVVAWALVAAVVVQVFLAGLGVMGHADGWRWHTTFVHTFELLPFVLIAIAWAGRAPWRLVGASAVLFVLIALQYVLVGLGSPWLKALHPTNALVILVVALYAARQAGLLQTRSGPAAVPGAAP